MRQALIRVLRRVETMTGSTALDISQTSLCGYRAEVHSSINSIAALDWDTCNGTGNKLSSHAYLRVMEESGALDQMTGVVPRLVMLRDGSGAAVAAAPAYLKSHSIGELGADFGFALSHTRSCGPYYPKLQVEIPLTPIVGPRLLIAQGQNADFLRRSLIKVLSNLAIAEKASSFQIAFMLPAEAESAREAGMMIHKDIQFVWRNQGYKTFGDFTREITKSRRHMVKRERRVSVGDDLVIEWIRGRDVSAELCSRLAFLFANTFSKYKTENWFFQSYFQQLFLLLGNDASVAAVTRPGGEVVGATLYLHNGDELIALQWGTSEFRQFLMLETTIYQGIERAINDGNASLNVGSLGRYKSNRGALPADICHAFWFCNDAFSPIAEAAIQARSRGVAHEKKTALEGSPFRSDRTATAC